MAETKAKQSKDRVDEIIATGKHKGVLTHDELNQTLTDEEMEPSQLENILNELEKRTIKVVKTLPDDLEPDAKELAEEEVITEQELASDYIPDTVNIDDPVKMYLKEIGRVPLLSATEEIEIAKRMHIRKAPEFRFVADDGAKYAAHINELIAGLEREER